jgi:phosphoglycolate phosphatase-like HAD superfamily hydrolase
VEHTGRVDVVDFSFAGMTDPAIVRQGLARAGRDVDAEAIGAVLATYLRVLEEEVTSAERFVVHEGVHEVLVEALSWERSAVGLGTGNVRGGARVKLGRPGLYERFAFGGFGCDSEDRAELIRVGAERGAERLGVPRAECRVVVIGDTPKDVAAALAIGAEAIGVGTGPYTVEDLLACGATRAFRSLSEPGVLEALRGG